MSIVKVQVTAEDIAEGKAGDECFCPVALALCRSLRLQRGEMAVYPVAGKWTAGTPDVVFLLPEIAGRFASKFDLLDSHEIGYSREWMPPFDFDLEVNDELLEDEHPWRS
jgi:hypothetical protein